MTPARPPVAVLAALLEEAATLAGRLGRSNVTAPPPPEWEGELGGVPVVLMLTGVGKVAAAMATQSVCDRRAPRSILTIGLAGGVESGAAVGRVIVASGAVQHDFDARPLTTRRGVIPGVGDTPFPANVEIAGRLMNAASAVVGSDNVRFGLVLTGDQVVTSRVLRDGVLADFPSGTCFDMETAAVAQVACQNGIPWGGVRITSDSADETFDLEKVLGFGTGTAAELFDRMIRTFLMDESR